eukprot:TRINITY_DN328_c0_g1_i1.p1 TRINITY_DN328_c0_g1~~TRINITY_DN328_c0_g1_i1.p1  ORF type:complete len:129 (-),score=32.64 TRINITY_DN328_c0_g1_i1:182-568(-)
MAPDGCNHPHVAITHPSHTHHPQYQYHHHHQLIMSKPGGLKESQAATADVQALVDQVKADAEAKSGNSYASFTAVSFSTQTVAGVNYFVKVNAGDTHVHVRIFKDLKGNVSLAAQQDGKAAGDDITYF